MKIGTIIEVNNSTFMVIEQTDILKKSDKEFHSCVKYPEGIEVGTFEINDDQIEKVIYIPKH